MAEGFVTVELCAAGHPPVETQATEVVVPGDAGIFTVLPGHTPLLTGLCEGVVIARTGDAEPEFFAVHGGFCEVARDKVTILADLMETRAAIDEDRAKAALDRAEERLQKTDKEIDVSRAQAALARAMARLRAHAMEE